MAVSCHHFGFRYKEPHMFLSETLQFFFLQHYSVGSPDRFDYPSQNPQEPQPVVRKTARWDPTEHRIFIDVCKIVIVERHQSSKCFSTTGWLCIYELFNSTAGKDWTVSQLKNYWGKLRTDHKHFFELLKSSGIQYQSKIDRIIGLEHWWEAKIKENRKYAKYKNMNCSEIYDTYGKLFCDAGDSTKYALSPSKLSQRGFDLGTDNDKDDGGDKLPINTEGTDYSDSPVDYRAYSSMNISGNCSGDKRKNRHGKDKGKRKKYGAREVSASLK
ncbi:Hypothetical predicted protein [Olea europaea subsp. europaea]|uniref:Myb/SANT-like domain-containing protein n=1 Tax=Olea europaea subsp. europaea TaxID=158383 RepID=A0A8S0PMX9_OLEEU|nr:Hypothetical predicted protein [Olea europaea subsp. europaea]